MDFESQERKTKMAKMPLEGWQELGRVRQGLIRRAWKEAERDGQRQQEGLLRLHAGSTPIFLACQRGPSRPHGRTMIGLESYSIPLGDLLV